VATRTSLVGVPPAFPPPDRRNLDAPGEAPPGDAGTIDAT
jgi:hypothetical protein